MPETKIYFAHNYEARIKLVDEIAKLQYLLFPFKIEVTSSWINNTDQPISSTLAYRDYMDIFRSDIFILFADPFEDRQSIGKHVELGIAFALKKIIIIISEDVDPQHIFYLLPGVLYCNKSHYYDVVADIISRGK